MNGGTVFLVISRNEAFLGPAPRVDDLRIRVVNNEDFTHDIWEILPRVVSMLGNEE